MRAWPIVAVTATLLALVVLATIVVDVESVNQQEAVTESNPGTGANDRSYVAIGDSFSSGEGEPYLDPQVLQDEYKVNSLNELDSCILFPRLRTPLCGPSPDFVENKIGWLGDTGTDVDKLPLEERLIAGVAATKSFGGNNCHRSAHAYPVRLHNLLADTPQRWQLKFVACSGATTEHFREPFRGESPQRDAFASGPADIVSIGFGGNDVGFGNLVICGVTEAIIDRITTITSPITSDYHTRIDACKQGMQPGLPERLDRLRANLSALVADVRRNHLKQDGRIIMVGYPRVFPDEPPDSCSLGAASSIGRDSMIWLNDVADRINAEIRTVAIEHQVSYLDTTSLANVESEVGHAHDFCEDNGAVRWFNRLIPSDIRRSMHPKFEYHVRVAKGIEECLSDVSSCNPELTIHNWADEVNKNCYIENERWTAASSNETKIRAMSRAAEWLRKVPPAPATPGARLVLNNRIAIYESSARALKAFADPSVSPARLYALERERDSHLTDGAQLANQNIDAYEVLFALTPACR
ncbi:SGNH/GDSL hydrolase family protein [Pseudonocardia sp. NPDC049635]|uniref:SGNH/GDSL hydrolase family protein n=1 Tax=Pseudonocardia sp. NPDC049635 TaxID=3155506 RepID=UPI003410D144